MKIRKLVEEFAEWAKENNVNYPIYKNPNLKELKELIQENKRVHEDKGYSLYKEDDEYYIRFIIDKINKNLYLFSEHLLHEPAAKTLGLPYNFNGIKGYIFGKGKLNKNLKIKTKEKINLKELKRYFI